MRNIIKEVESSDEDFFFFYIWGFSFTLAPLAIVQSIISATVFFLTLCFYDHY